MTKRLIDAARLALMDYRLLLHRHEGHMLTRADELQAAIEAARQPVTVTPDQAVEILVVMLTTFGESASQADIDALSAEAKQEIVGVVTAILQRARELGL